VGNRWPYSILHFETGSRALPGTTICFSQIQVSIRCTHLLRTNALGLATQLV
jgi:hypothetical protein